MKNKYCTLSLVFLFILSSCSDDKNADQEKVTPPTIQEADVFLTKEQNEKYDVLGYGYDVTGEYLNPNSIKSQVIDINTFIREVPHRFESSGIFETRSGQMSSGEDFVSYQKDIQNQVNYAPYDWADFMTGFESAVFVGEISQLGQDISEYSFARNEIAIRRQRAYEIDANAETLSRYLAQTFKDDITSLSALAIIEKYGTHVLTNIEKGGILKANYRSIIVIPEERTSFVVRVGLAIALKYVGLEYGSGSSAIDSAIASGNYDHSNTDISVDLLASGGKLDLLISGGLIGMGPVQLNPKKITTDFDLNIGDWLMSINDDNSVLVNVKWKYTYPIYEFITDPIIKQSVKEAFRSYIESKKVDL